MTHHRRSTTEHQRRPSTEQQSHQPTDPRDNPSTMRESQRELTTKHQLRSSAEHQLRPTSRRGHPVLTKRKHYPQATQQQRPSVDQQHRPCWKLQSLLQSCKQVCRESGWMVPRYRIRNSQAVTISSLAHDSRTVAGGALFFALTGWSVDGHRFVASAIERGAVAVVHSQPLTVYHPQVCYIRTSQPRKLMSLIADVYYGSPSAHLTIVGVTGTDGKSTSCNFVYQLLRAHGVSCGLVSTVSRDIGSGLVHNTDHQTTPESIDIHKALATMVRCRYTHAVLELSSHALSYTTARALHVRLHCAIVTNIAKEHLEFHKTVRRYVRDKLNIIAMLPNRRAHAVRMQKGDVQHSSEGHSARIMAAEIEHMDGYAEEGATRRAIEDMKKSIEAHAEEVVTEHAERHTETKSRANKAAMDAGAMPAVWCGTSASLTKRIVAKSNYPVVNYDPAHNHHLSLSCTEHSLTHSSYRYTMGNEAVDISVGFFGRYNILNAVAAMLCVSHLLSLSLLAVAEHGNALSLPTGRFDIITRHHRYAFDIVIDYAHTAQSFATLLGEIKGMGYRRILAVFGSAGERDVQKRHDMGGVAARYCDMIIVTSEDPRHEDPQRIADTIVDGICAQAQPTRRFQLGDSVYVIHDRREAIFYAVSVLQPHDILLLLGKGHESSIINGAKQIVWNERSVAQQALAKYHNITV